MGKSLESDAIRKAIIPQMDQFTYRCSQLVDEYRFETQRLQALVIIHKMFSGDCKLC